MSRKPINSDVRRPKKSVWIRKQVYQWHRRIGVISAVLIIVLSMTGIALNHTVKLDLDGYIVNVRPLNIWYGLAPKSAPKSFKAGKLWITQLDSAMYIDTHYSGMVGDILLGAVFLEDSILIADKKGITFYSPEGQVFDQKNSEELPSAILAIGKTITNQVALKTNKGLFSSDINMEKWRPMTEPVIWSKSEIAPKNITKVVVAAYSGRGLPLSRVILDLHSGKIFGQWGLYLMDAAAIFLLFLTMTGLYNWSKRRSK